MKNTLGERSTREQQEYQYEYFKEKELRENYIEIIEKTVEYLHDNNIRSVVLVDRSTRNAGIGINTVWKKKYPDEERPDIFFINPNGFKNISMEDVQELIQSSEEGRSPRSQALERIRMAAQTAAMKGDRAEGPSNLRLRGEALVEFARRYKKLHEQKEQPIAVMDTCIHTGDALSDLLDGMKESGFKDIKVITTSNSHNRSNITPDFIARGKPGIEVCYPFGMVRAVEKTFSQSSSLRAEGPRYTREELEQIANSGEYGIEGLLFAVSEEPNVRAWEMTKSMRKDLVETLRRYQNDQEV